MGTMAQLWPWCYVPTTNNSCLIKTVDFSALMSSKTIVTALQASSSSLITVTFTQ